MGGHWHSADAGGRHAEPATTTRGTLLASRPSSTPSLPALPSLPPPPPTGVRGPTTGSRGPATGSRGPATGSRRAPGRRNLHWVPVALAIWIASFLAVPAAVLVHQAVSGGEPSVENAAETTDAEPGAGPVEGAAPADAPVAGDPAVAPGTGAAQHVDDADPGSAVLVDPADPAAPTSGTAPSAAAVVPGVPVVGTPTDGALVDPGGALSSSAAASSSAVTSTSAAVTSEAPVQSEPPVGAAQPQPPGQEVVAP